MSAPELNAAACFVFLVVVVDDDGVAPAAAAAAVEVESGDDASGSDPRRIVNVSVGTLASVCMVSVSWVMRSPFRLLSRVWLLMVTVA